MSPVIFVFPCDIKDHETSPTYNNKSEIWIEF